MVKKGQVINKEGKPRGSKTNENKQGNRPSK